MVKKRIFILLSVLVLILCNSCTTKSKKNVPIEKSPATTEKRKEKKLSGDLEFKFYKKYEVDDSNIKKCVGVEDNKPLTAFYELGNYPHLETLSREDDFDYTIVEYDEEMDNYWLAASFGREVESIQYKYIKPNWIATLQVTFKEEHTDNMMYIYLIEKNVPLLDPFLEGHKFYLLDNGEKIYVANYIEDISSNIEKYYSGREDEMIFCDSTKAD